MKHKAQLGSSITDARITDDQAAWPPPDASARVEMEIVPVARGRSDAFGTRPS